jgi:predicted secreted protein
LARTIGDNADLVYAGVALEDELNQVTLNFQVPEADITAFADAWQNSLAGKPKATLDISGFWDPAASQGDDTIFNDLGGAAQTWDFEPDGTTGYNGYAVLTSYSITAQVGQAISYRASMSHNGTSAAADAAAPTRA